MLLCSRVVDCKTALNLSDQAGLQFTWGRKTTILFVEVSHIIMITSFTAEKSVQTKFYFGQKLLA